MQGRYWAGMQVVYRAGMQVVYRAVYREVYPGRCTTLPYTLLPTHPGYTFLPSTSAAAVPVQHAAVRWEREEALGSILSFLPGQEEHLCAE